jgi:hypothetical protein
MPADSRAAYVDTSVLVKAYVEEPDSARALATLARHVVVSCAIAPIELTSAIRRRREQGDLTDRDVDLVRRRLQRDRRGWELHAVDESVLERAEDVARTVPVRTLDALHLACALTFRQSAGVEVPFVTADHRQRRAATALGLEAVFVE